MPYFVLLHLEPDEDTYARAPLYENPFFWTGVSLALFLATFLFVMSRMERRESASIDAHRIRLRKGIKLPRGPGTTGGPGDGPGAGTDGQSSGGGAASSAAPPPAP